MFGTYLHKVEKKATTLTNFYTSGKGGFVDRVQHIQISTYFIEGLSVMHIYEAADASLQLQAFYKQISSPLLSDVEFKYSPDAKDITKSRFPIYFGGAELIVSGRCSDSPPVSVNCCGRKGPIILRPTIERPVSSLERLWAYMTVKQLLEKKESVDNKTEILKQATELALKYSFVTEVTSLVVVKPKETNAVDVGVEKPDDELTGATKIGKLRGPRLYCKAAPSLKQSFGGILNGLSVYCEYIVFCLRIWKKMYWLHMIVVRWSNASQLLHTSGYLEAEDVLLQVELNKNSIHKKSFTISIGSTLSVLGCMVPRFSLEEESEKKKPTPEFIADHPFFIILRKKRSDGNIILFATVGVFLLAFRSAHRILIGISPVVVNL
ncbi:hypothetical protein NQ317_000242 [Molorchus minor]|uniref:Uncharacterized protein n=1 Tax=Molorchus minor TaxID=1323400 RepID=A0ABQ9JTD8_9CUCU|nr:hypothetical protein NQ317_000242 [Molorchus minor]